MSGAGRDDPIRHAVARSFDSLQSMEMMPPDEAGATAANSAFRRALDAEAARRTRRRAAAKTPAADPTAIEG